MSHAYIINFTGHFGHWGMFGTSMTLALALGELGYETDVLEVDAIANLFRPRIPWQRMKSRGSFERFAEKNPDVVKRMLDTDIVVVNGEGTLHGHRPSSLNLLALIYFARVYAKKPVYLINSAFFPSSFGGEVSAEEVTPYAETLRKLERGSIVVRDRGSFANVAALGGRPILGFDSLPLLIKALPASAFQPDKRADRIIMSAAAGWSPSQCRPLGRIAKRVAPTADSIDYISGGTEEFKRFEHRYHAAIKEQFEGLGLIEAETFAQFCRTLSGSLLISGRFHYLIAGAWLDAMLAPFESNTRKNEELAAELKLRAGKLSPPTGHAEDLLLLANAVKKARPIPGAVREGCESRALRNFDCLPRGGPPIQSKLALDMAGRLGLPLAEVKPITLVNA